MYGREKNINNSPAMADFSAQSNNGMEQLGYNFNY